MICPHCKSELTPERVALLDARAQVAAVEKAQEGIIPELAGAIRAGKIPVEEILLAVFEDGFVEGITAHRGKDRP